MANKNIITIIGYLVISLVFIIPMQAGLVFADDTADQTVSREQVSSTCSIEPPLDVKSSFILSAVTMCIPGVLEKIQEWKEMHCEAAVCIYEAGKNSLDPSFCDSQFAYKTCKYYIGEIFAIPPLAILEYLREFMAGLIANPMGIAYAAGVKIARQYLDTTCVQGGNCDATGVGATAIFLAVNDLLAVYQSFTDIQENGFKDMFGFGDDDSPCEDIESIKEELESLV